MSRAPSAPPAQGTDPAIGRWIPTGVGPLAHLAVVAALALLVLDGPIWRSVVLLLACGRLLLPGLIAPWWLLLSFILSQLLREPAATDARLHLLLAGLPLLHLVGSLDSVLPRQGRLQLGALSQPIRRFVLVQALVHPVAAGALFLFDRQRGTMPGLSIVSAALLGVIALLLARPLAPSPARPLAQSLASGRSPLDMSNGLR